MKGIRFGAAVLALGLVLPGGARAFSGSEGASFLDIPVGGRAAGLGSAYSALASDGLAPVWNPGGLGFAKQAEASLMHLSYMESMAYESLSVAAPIKGGHGIGGSIQYFRAGDIAATDSAGNALGDFGGYYLAASLGYGRVFAKRFGVGVTGRLLTAQIAGVGASAFAADIGGMAQVSSRLRVAAVAANLGSGLRFLDEADPLPAQLRLGAALDAGRGVTVSLEGVRAFRSDDSVHAGLEWRPIGPFAVRAGYRSDVGREAGSGAGVTLGTGLFWKGYSVDYAWVPLGDLGHSQYFSLAMRFGTDSGPDNIEGGGMIVLP